MIRAFVALELSESLKDGILSLIDELRGAGVRASWSRAATLHLTLYTLDGIPVLHTQTGEDGVRTSDGIVVWDGRLLDGMPAPPGLYLYRMEAVERSGVMRVERGRVVVSR